MTMEEPIRITMLNDFIFCPASIYFHRMYEDLALTLYQDDKQLEGRAAHESVDNVKYSTRKNILQGASVYCEKYNLTGKIDVFDSEKGFLVERKKKIQKIYDGYVFQVYGQCFALREMNYSVNRIRLHSMDDNKNFEIPLPEDDPLMLKKFEDVIERINNFDINKFMPENESKCQMCIYNRFCDRTLDDRESL